VDADRRKEDARTEVMSGRAAMKVQYRPPITFYLFLFAADFSATSRTDPFQILAVEFVSLSDGTASSINVTSEGWI